MTLVDDPSELPILPENALNLTISNTPPPTDSPLQVSATPISPPTPPDPSRRPLSPRQLEAISLLLAGRSDRDVADAIRVRRETICQWRNHHPLFIAELNRQRTRRHADTLDRLDRVLNNALKHVEEHQAATGYYLTTQVALATRLLGTFGRRVLASPAPPPATNPDDIHLQLLTDALPISPDDSPAEDAPPPPPPPPKKTRK